MELGLATFADLASGVSPEQRMRELLTEADLAEQVGLDLFAVGEHHRPDFLVYVMRSIELFGTEVAPIVRGEIARRDAGAAEAA